MLGNMTESFFTPYYLTLPPYFELFNMSLVDRSSRLLKN